MIKGAIDLAIKVLGTLALAELALKGAEHVYAKGAELWDKLVDTHSKVDEIHSRVCK